MRGRVSCEVGGVGLHLGNGPAAGKAPQQQLDRTGYAPPHTRTPDALAVAAAHAPCHRRVYAGRGRLDRIGWPVHSASRAGPADDLGRRSRRPPSRRSVAVGGLSIGGTASRPPFPHVTLAVSNRQLSSHAHPIWMHTMREWLHPRSCGPYERRAAEVSAPRAEPLQSVVTRPRAEPLQQVVTRPRS